MRVKIFFTRQQNIKRPCFSASLIDRSGPTVFTLPQVRRTYMCRPSTKPVYSKVLL